MSSTDVNISPSSSNALKGWNHYLNVKQIVDLLDRPYATTIAMAIVLLVAAFFRFQGLTWDEGRHLHPDERFL